MSDVLIALERIAYRIRGRTILHDISLELARDDILTIVGPNGAGKSTLIKLILGLIKPSSGHIRRVSPLNISLVPQQFTIPADLPITAKRFLRDVLNADSEEWLSRLGILELMNSAVQNLSGGERQRLLLARAILRNPDLIALDEPAAGIDPATLGDFYRLIRDYQQQSGASVVMVSHDLHLVMAATDRVICLNGHICCQGQPQELATHPDFLIATGHAIKQPVDIPNESDIAIYTHQHTHTH